MPRRVLPLVACLLALSWTALLAAALVAPSQADAAGVVAPRSPISGSAAFRGHGCLLDARRNGLSLAPINIDQFPRATGRVRGMMLFVDFPDQPHASDEDTRRLHDQLATDAVKRLRIASGGRLRLQVPALHRWLRMPAAHTAYDTSDGDNQYRLLRDAVRAADRHVSFRGVDFVYVVPTLDGASAQSPAFIAGTRDIIRADGNRIWFGASFGIDALAEDARYGSRILLHETGHLFGLSDLYRYRPVGGDHHVDVGAWDPMGNAYGAAGFSQWTRWLLQWIPGRQAVCVPDGPGRTVTLFPQSLPRGIQLLYVPTGRSTAVVVERRADRGSDRGTCDDGVLVYRVNARVHSGSGPMRIVPARRAASDECGELGHAAFERGPGERCWVVVDRVRIEVVREGAVTSVVRVRSAASRMDPRVRTCT